MVTTDNMWRQFDQRLDMELLDRVNLVAEASEV